MKYIINITIFLLFISVCFFDGFLGDGLGGKGLHLIPGRFSWLSELSSMAIAVNCFVLFAMRKKVSIPIFYVLFFFIFILFSLTGIVLNTVPSGAIFAGIRRYFIFYPLFFLPTLYSFSESEIKKQLKAFILIGLIQIPFAIYQNFFLFKDAPTGDFVTGTFLTSTALTINQLICISLLTALFIKKHTSKLSYVIILVLLIIPTTINETKATLILLPVAISIPILFATSRVFSLKKIMLTSASIPVIFAIFVPIYNYFYKADILYFFDYNEEQGVRTIKGYLFKGLSIEELNEEPGRIDSLLFPFRILRNEPFKLIFGLGIGNVNKSGIGRFKGEYNKYDKYGANMIAVSSMIWETGLIGFLLYFTLMGVILFDGFRLRKMNNIYGVVSLAWVAIIIMLYLCLFYSNIFHIKVIGYLFFYGSGLIVSKRANIQSA
jgi:hypothetical protein